MLTASGAQPQGPSRLRTLTVQYRRDLLSLLLRDNRFCRAVAGKVPDDLFDHAAESRMVFLALRGFVEEHRHRPKKHELDAVLERAAGDAGLDAVRTKALVDHHDDLRKHDSYTPSFVKQQLVDALTVHEIKRVIHQGPDLLDRGEYDEFVAAVVKARNLVAGDEEIVDFWEDAEDRARRRRSAERASVPTGIPTLDESIGGGHPYGKLGVVLASTGRGKTAIMSHMATQAVLGGHDALFCTFEEDADDIMARVDANMTQISLDDLPLRRNAFLSRLHGIVTQPRELGGLYVVSQPAKKVSVTDIHGLLERMEAENGSVPDVMYLDYFDLLRMEGSFDKKHEAQEENMEMLRGLAKEWDLSLWTATQTNRGALSKDVVDKDDMASSYGKAFPLDLLVTASQTQREKRLGVMRLFVAKGRYCQAGDTVFVRPDFPTMRMQCLTQAEVRRMNLSPSGDDTPGKSPMGAQA